MLRLQTSTQSEKVSCIFTADRRFAEIASLHHFHPQRVASAQYQMLSFLSSCPDSRSDPNTEGINAINEYIGP
jgi:hypothetical protein